MSVDTEILISVRDCKIVVSSNRDEPVANGPPKARVARGRKVNWRGDPDSVAHWVVGFDGKEKDPPFVNFLKSKRNLFSARNNPMASDAAERNPLDGARIEFPSPVGPKIGDEFKYWIFCVTPDGKAFYDDPIIVVQDDPPLHFLKELEKEVIEEAERARGKIEELVRRFRSMTEDSQRPKK